MASARAKMGSLRRKIVKRQKRAAVGKGILSTVGTVATFAGSQAKKAETAWGEYEAGYKELGGTEAITRPKFGQKGYFKGPEGEVSIGEGKARRTYDVGKVTKAGSFLGSDAASILSPEQRQQYLGRTAPGRADVLATGGAGVGFGKGPGGWTTSGYTSRGTGGTTEGGEGFVSGVGRGFGQGTSGVQKDFLKDYQAPSMTGGERGRGATETAGIQAQQQEQLALMSQGRAPGLFRQTREGGAPMTQDDSLDAILQRQSASATTAEKAGIPRLGPSGMGTGDIKKAWDTDSIGKVATTEEMKPMWNMQRLKQGVQSYFSPGSVYGKMDGEMVKHAGGTRSQEFRKKFSPDVLKQEQAYARGGDFITNGPQKILVGDNPGGRERVTIRPLPSSNDRSSSERRSLLESLYENNRRRKKY